SSVYSSQFILFLINLLYIILFFFFILRLPPTSTLFPYTTLFRSGRSLRDSRERAAGCCLAPSRHRRTSTRWARWKAWRVRQSGRSEEHTSELQSQSNLVCRLLLEKKKKKIESTH